MNKQSVKIQFNNIDLATQHKVLNIIHHLIDRNAFSNPPVEITSSIEIFKDFVITDNHVITGIDKPQDSINDVPNYERAFDSFIQGDKEVFLGSIFKCFNCGRPDHIISDCKEKRDPREIEKNKQFYFEFSGRKVFESPPIRYFEVVDPKSESSLEIPSEQMEREKRKRSDSSERRYGSDSRHDFRHDDSRRMYQDGNDARDYMDSRNDRFNDRYRPQRRQGDHDRYPYSGYDYHYVERDRRDDDRNRYDRKHRY